MDISAASIEAAEVFLPFESRSRREVLDRRSRTA
jgi:hypothetical protein